MCGKHLNPPLDAVEVPASFNRVPVGPGGLGCDLPGSFVCGAEFLLLGGQLVEVAVGPGDPGLEGVAGFLDRDGESTLVADTHCERSGFSLWRQGSDRCLGW